MTGLRVGEGLLQPLSAPVDCPWRGAVRGLTSVPQAPLWPGATAQLPEPGRTCLDADPVPHHGPRTTSPVSAMPCREQARGHFIVLCGPHSALPPSGPSSALCPHADSGDTSSRKALLTPLPLVPLILGGYISEPLTVDGLDLMSQSQGHVIPRAGAMIRLISVSARSHEIPYIFLFNLPSFVKKKRTIILYQ